MDLKEALEWAETVRQETIEQYALNACKASRILAAEIRRLQEQVKLLSGGADERN